MSGPESPVVLRDEASAPFFDAASRGVLLLRHCTRCGRWGPPALHRCRSCHTTELEWLPSEGTAELVSWTVVHAKPLDGESPEPAIVGLVELSEGPWFTTRLAGMSGSELRAGLALRVDFVRPDGGEALPFFTPA